MKGLSFGMISHDDLRNAIVYSSAEDIDIRRMAEELSLRRDHDDELRAWSRSRLECCRAALTGHNGELGIEQVNQYELETRIMQTVLRLLDGDPTPTYGDGRDDA